MPQFGAKCRVLWHSRASPQPSPSATRSGWVDDHLDLSDDLVAGLLGGGVAAAVSGLVCLHGVRVGGQRGASLVRLDRLVNGHAEGGIEVELGREDPGLLVA